MGMWWADSGIYYRAAHLAAERNNQRYAMNSMTPGGGGRFAAMVKSGKSPALAAYIGRKKYGAKKMASFAKKGRARHDVQSGSNHGHFTTQHGR